jgi:hypothetical protein
MISQWKCPIGNTEKPASGFEPALQEGKLSAISGVGENVDFRRLRRVGPFKCMCFRIPVKTVKPCEPVI